MSIVHIRNGRADRHPQTRGVGSTWCGKKLLGDPVVELTTEIFTTYGSEIRATVDPTTATCNPCQKAFDAAYAAAFPDGLKPIATFRTDDPADLERAKAVLSPEALTRFFSPGGGGMAAFTDALATSRSQHEGAENG